MHALRAHDPEKWEPVFGQRSCAKVTLRNCGATPRRSESAVVPLFGRASFACRFGLDGAHGFGASRGGGIPILLRVGFALAILIPFVSAAAANDPKVERMLQQLDPDARFEQICD